MRKHDIDNPADDFVLALGRAALLVFAAIVVAASAGVAYKRGYFREADQAAVTAKLETAAREHKALRPDQLSHPLGPCDLTLREMVGPVVVRPEQCYRRKP